METHYYISPHLDDAVFSCGGVMLRQSSQGDEVVVLTICAGDPPQETFSPFAMQLHRRWGEERSPIDLRREEDRRACERLGAKYLRLTVPDAIYRTNCRGEALYDSEEAIFGPLHPEEEELVARIEGRLLKLCTPSAVLYAPTGFGGHVDHRLTRKAMARWKGRVRFYRDFPYVLLNAEVPQEIGLPEGEGRIVRLEAGEIHAWADAIREYQSQLSTFWSDPGTIDEELQAMHDLFGGVPFIAVEN
jgi:LmbE family N-acetylglucosaminyl deacetylase